MDLNLDHVSLTIHCPCASVQNATNRNLSNLINAIWATMGIIFTLNAVWTADRFGRRWLFIVGAIGMATCMLIVPIIDMRTPTVNGTKSQPVAIAIVFMLYVFM